MDPQELAVRLARGGLLAAGIGFAVTTLLLTMEVAAGQADFMTSGAFANSETFGVIMGTVLFPALVLMPLPDEHRWALAAVRGVSLGGAFGYFTYVVAQANARTGDGIAFPVIVGLIWLGASLLFAVKPPPGDSPAPGPPEPPDWTKGDLPP